MKSQEGQKQNGNRTDRQNGRGEAWGRDEMTGRWSIGRRRKGEKEQKNRESEE